MLASGMIAVATRIVGSITSPTPVSATLVMARLRAIAPEWRQALGANGVTYTFTDIVDILKTCMTAISCICCTNPKGTIWLC